MLKFSTVYKELKEQEEELQKEKYTLYCDMDGVLLDFGLACLGCLMEKSYGSL